MTSHEALTDAKPEVKESGDDTSVSRMAAGAGISLFGVGVGRGLDFIKQIALARLLGPEAFGLYAVGWNILRIIGIIAPLGLQNGVIHFGTPFVKKDRAALSAVITKTVLLSFAIGWLFTIILLILGPWITTDFLREPEYLPLFRVFTLMLPFMAALRVAANATRISQRMIFSVLSEEIMQGALTLFLFLAFYLLGWQLFGAIFATVLSFAGGFLLALYFIWHLFGKLFTNPRRASISNRAMLAFTLPTALAGIFSVIIGRVDRIFLGFYWPADVVGVYQAAAQISVILALVLNAFNMILSPMVAEKFHKGDMKQLEELYRVNTKWGIYCAVPIVLVVAFAAQEVMTVLFGIEYVGGTAALRILTIGQFVNIATGATGIILVMTGQQTWWFRLSMMLLVANLTLNLTLIPVWGMNGAAVATATTVGGLFATALLIVYRIHHIWPYDRRYVKGIIAAAVTMIPLFIVQLLHLPPLPKLLLTSIVATMGFLGLLLLQGIDLEDREFIRLILNRMKK